MTEEKSVSTRFAELFASARTASTTYARPNSTQTRDCPRFNMPFELGLFLGARRFGGRSHNRKKTLIFDRDPFRYQSYISDIAGQDIHPHKGDVDALIGDLAAWLRDEARDPKVPGGVALASEFGKFKVDLPAIVDDMRLQLSELTYKDLVEIVVRWIPKEPEI
jgi:hypothetical protein